MVKNNKLGLILIVLQFFLKYGGFVKFGDDLHSSVTALQDVLKTEELLMDNLEDYLYLADKKVVIIKRFLNNLKNQHDHFINETLFSPTTDDPISSFKLKQRISVNVSNLKRFFNRTGEKIVENINNTQDGYELPNIYDLEGVTLGMLRVQQMYDINAEEMAAGQIMNISFGAKFSAADCFEVGSQLQNLEYYYYSVQWLKAALKIFRQEKKIGIAPEIDEVKILDMLSYSQFKEDSVENVKAAIATAVEGLSLDINHPNIEHIAENLKIFLGHYNDLITGKKESLASHLPKGPFLYYNVTERLSMKKGCRGEYAKTPRQQRDLYCKYENKNHPFLMLAPIKVEVANIDPNFYIFHDVLYDAEIEKLKNLSMQNLFRAGVWNEEKGIGEPSLVRTSKFFWFTKHPDPIIPILDQRVSDMTGLSMKTAEDFQLMNYGIGGHYDIHPDYFNEPDPEKNIKPYGFYENGNRISTVLFYMSDVQVGGATVFPVIETAALPQKGTAAFWYNLHADGEFDDRLRHSGCPVVSGSKWVLNKWIRQKEQEFRRPCKLQPDH